MKLAALLVLAAIGMGGGVALANEPDAATHARQEFVRGVELAKRAQWAEARSAFESSLAERSHPVTRYNLALCDRALGATVQSVHQLRLALAVTGSDALSGATREEATRLLAQLEPERAFVDVARNPEEVVTVDGRALEPLGPYFAPATNKSGAERALPIGTLHIALDPGRHEIRVQRDGYAPAALETTLAAGETRTFAPRLVQRPGLLFVSSMPVHARARVDGKAPLPLPLSVAIAQGPHRIDVELPGYAPFTASVMVRSEVRSVVHAELTKKHVSVLRRWWFWTAIGGALVTAGAVTYALTRPEAAPDGGSLGWVARP